MKKYYYIFEYKKEVKIACLHCEKLTLGMIACLSKKLQKNNIEYSVGKIVKDAEIAIKLFNYLVKERTIIIIDEKAISLTKNDECNLLFIQTKEKFWYAEKVYYKLTVGTIFDEIYTYDFKKFEISLKHTPFDLVLNYKDLFKVDCSNYEVFLKEINRLKKIEKFRKYKIRWWNDNVFIQIQCQLNKWNNIWL